MRTVITTHKKLVVCSHECNQTYFIFVNITVFVYLLIIQSFYSDSQKFRAIITLQAIIAHGINKE